MSGHSYSSNGSSESSLRDLVRSSVPDVLQLKHFDDHNDRKVGAPDITPAGHMVHLNRTVHQGKYGGFAYANLGGPFTDEPHTPTTRYIEITHITRQEFEDEANNEGVLAWMKIVSCCVSNPSFSNAYVSTSTQPSSFHSLE
jgi:hypothetical protein